MPRKNATVQLLDSEEAKQGMRFVDIQKFFFARRPSKPGEVLPTFNRGFYSSITENGVLSTFFKKEGKLYIRNDIAHNNCPYKTIRLIEREKIERFISLRDKKICELLNGRDFDKLNFQEKCDISVAAEEYAYKIVYPNS